MEALGVRTMATTASASAPDRGLATMAAGRPLGGVAMGQCAMVAIGNKKGSTSNELRLGSGLYYQRTSFLPHAGLLRRTQRGENVSRKGGLIVVEASASSSSPGDDAVGAGDAGSGLETAQAGVGTSELAATLKLGSLFGLWYLFNIYFNMCACLGHRRSSLESSTVTALHCVVSGPVGACNSETGAGLQPQV